MGFMDSLKERFANKDKAQDAARQHGDKIDDGIDRGGKMADDRTGGKHGDQINSGTDKAKDARGKFAGEDDA